MPCDTTTLFAVSKPAKPGMSLVTAAVIFFLAVAAAYGCAINSPFVHEDKYLLLWNPLFGHNGHVSSFLFEEVAQLRPLVFVSFYINTLISGQAVWSYHLVNMLFHALAALTLFGIIRLSMRWPRLREQYWDKRDCLSLACALIWTLHPLQTQSVTYISQRSECLAGLFLFLTLYCAIHFFQAKATRSRRKWLLLSALNLFAGALCKEYMVMVVPMVLCYEHVCRGVKRSSLSLYLAYLPGLIAAVVLFFLNPELNEGIAAIKAGRLSYFLTQAEVIWGYIRLAFWPDALSFDYVHPLDTLSGAWPYGAGLLLLMALAVWGVWTRKFWSLALGFFFLALAPTSSIFPLPALIAENRMYVPLAGLAVLTVFALFHFGRHLLRISMGGPENRARTGLILGRAVLCVCCAGLLVLTIARNRDYNSELGLWLDTIAKQPANYRAYAWVGALLVDRGEPEKAIPYLEESLRIKPNSFNARLHMGRALSMLDHSEEALRWFREALSLNPTNALLCNHVGIVLFELGKTSEAREVFGASKRLEPNNPTADKYLKRLAPAL